MFLEEEEKAVWLTASEVLVPGHFTKLPKAEKVC